MSALTEKDYICREKLVIGYKDQLNRLWHIMHFLHLNRLCQTQQGSFRQAEECFFRYTFKDFNIQAETPFIYKHKQKSTALPTLWEAWHPEPGCRAPNHSHDICFVLIWRHLLSLSSLLRIKHFLKIRRTSSKKVTFI